MPSPINEAFRASQVALMSVFGEGIEIIPMTSGDYSTGRDTTREKLTLTASLVTQVEGVSLKGQGQGRGSEFQGTTRALTDDPQLWIDADTLSGLAWKPRRGDIVVAVGRPDQPRFTVTAPYPGDQGDLHVILTRGAATLPPEPDPQP